MDPDRHTSLATALAPHLHRLATPALVLDLDAVDHNIAAVLARCPAARWRPHVKTIKSAAVVDRLLAHGVIHSKVATLDELDLVLACADRRDLAADVLVAYPPHEAGLRALLSRAAASPRSRVHVLLDGPEHAAAVSSWLARAPALTRDETLRLPVHLDVDLGMARTGSPPAAWAAAAHALAADPRLAVTGLHGYEGHLEWHDHDLAAAAYAALLELAGTLTAAGLSSLRGLVTSGTHSYAAALAHRGLSEGPWHHQISPGTLVLSDLRSAAAAADLGLRQAAFVAARVISRGPGRVTLDAGSKAVAPDRPAPSSAVLGWPGLEPSAVSEEHLVVRVECGAAAPALGDLVFLVPDHVCTTVNLYRRALVLRAGSVGEAAIEAAGHRLWLEETP